MRICSLLPGATEVVFALGLGDQIVAVTHECDFPPEAQYKPVVVRSNIDAKRMTSREIDRQVSATLQGGQGLYSLDGDALMAAAPDLILTQGLCDVCALDYNTVVKAAEALPTRPQIVSLNPHSLEDIFSDIIRIGEVTDKKSTADAMVNELRQRIARVGALNNMQSPRVVCIEWFDPIYVAGHWVPEIITLAGGRDILGRTGGDSYAISWDAIVDADPDVILLMPCGFDVRRTVREADPLRNLPGWNSLRAVKTEQVYALNGNGYYSRPGPRLVKGLEILAHLLHPKDIGSPPSPSAAKRVIH